MRRGARFAIQDRNRRAPWNRQHRSKLRSRRPIVIMGQAAESKSMEARCVRPVALRATICLLVSAWLGLHLERAAAQYLPAGVPVGISAQPVPAMQMVPYPGPAAYSQAVMVPGAAGLTTQPVAAGMGRTATRNFIVLASSQQQADTMAEAAERYRSQLAKYWLGQELPDWPQPCPISVRASQRLGAGGSTSFTLIGGSVTGWRMQVQGSEERILDSVLPHEITHTILATHLAPLGKPIPRWADEGACSTMEHASETAKHEKYLIQFLQEGRGIAFAEMFRMKEYPSDIMPLYAQGYSVAKFLIEQSGPQAFVQFVESGMRTEDWVAALEQHYGYPLVGKLQTAWNQWVANGRGAIQPYTAVALGLSRRSVTIAENASRTTNPQGVRLASAISPIDSSAAPYQPAIAARPVSAKPSTDALSVAGIASDHPANSLRHPAATPEPISLPPALASGESSSALPPLQVAIGDAAIANSSPPPIDPLPLAGPPSLVSPPALAVPAALPPPPFPSSSAPSIPGTAPAANSPERIIR